MPWAGGVVVPINIRLAPPEIAAQLHDGGVEFVVVDETFAGLATTLDRDHLPPNFKGFIFAGDATHATHVTKNTKNTPPVPAAAVAVGCAWAFEELASHPPVPDSGRGGDDTFGLFFTGGTTGRPKGVQLTHSNIVVNALGHVAALQYVERHPPNPPAPTPYALAPPPYPATPYPILYPVLDPVPEHR